MKCLTNSFKNHDSIKVSHSQQTTDLTLFKTPTSHKSTTKKGSGVNDYSQ